LERVDGSEVGGELAFAISTAHQAGRLLCGLFGQRHTVGHKSSEIDLVTEADTASERLIVDAIHGRFPDHLVLAEEGLGDLLPQLVPPQSPALTQPEDSSTRLREKGLWIVDPLDGTVNYAHGYSVWGVSLALVVGGRVEVAVSHDPLRRETYWAARGRGAWCNGRRLEVSEVARLGEALLATGFAYSRATVHENNLAEFNAIMPRVHGVRRAGAAVLDMAHVAAGRLDGYWELWLSPWDWAAGWLLVEEAGGAVTDMDGQPWSLNSSKIVASNGFLHVELLDALKRARRP
jgi:myo-inositol-1(or 4)-monophosphatase